MITITLNEQQHSLPVSTTLADLAQQADTPRTVAIALNGAVVMRPDWCRTRLVDGDTVRLIQAIGAG